MFLHHQAHVLAPLTKDVTRVEANRVIGSEVVWTSDGESLTQPIDDRYGMILVDGVGE